MKDKDGLMFFPLFTLPVVMIVTLAVFLLVTSGGQRTSYFWLSLVIVLFCEVLTFGYFILYSTNTDRNDIPALFGVLSLICLYDAAVILSMLLFWRIYTVRFPLYVSIHLILFAFFFVIAAIFPVYTQRVSAENQDLKNVKASKNRSLSKLEEMLFKAEALQGESIDVDRMLLKLSQLKEQVIYSDPVSHPDILVLEEKIESLLSQLNTKMEEVFESDHISHFENLIQLLDEIGNALTIRNNSLAKLK